MLGAASLAVFVAHLVIALLALTYLGAPTPGRPLWVDVGLFAGSFAILYLVAYVTQQIDQRSARARTRLQGLVTQGSRALISRRHRA